MNKVNQWVLSKDDYEDEESFANKIGRLMLELSKDGYIAVFRYEDCGIYVIEYDYLNREFGCPYPYWLTPEEEESVIYEDDNEDVSDEHEYSAECDGQQSMFGHDIK